MVRHAFEIVLILTTVLCWIHYYYFSGKNLSKVIIYFIAAMIIGQVSEAVAIMLTGGYHYPGYWWYIGRVPVFIAIGWGYGLYLGYLLGSQFAKRWQDSKYYILVFSISCSVGAVLFQLFAEVPNALFEFYPWERGSGYYGIPISNFVGLFVFQATYNGTYKFIFSRSGWGRRRQVVAWYLSLVPICIVTGLSWLPFL